MALADTMQSPAALAWAEEVLARHGIAVVSREIAELADRLLQAPQTATAAEWQAVRYAIASCPWPAGSPLVMA